MSKARDRPVMSLTIRLNGPNGTDIRPQNVTNFTFTDGVLHLTKIDPETGKKTKESHERATVIGGAATLELDES